MDLLQEAGRLGAALAVGLLVGLERGWQDRNRPEGGRVAGFRTFALIGLLGGVLNLHPGSPLPLALGLGGIALLFAVSFGRASSAMGSLSITTAVAALVTFGLGALAARGDVILAVGSAAVVALLLGNKGEIHQGIRRIQPAEMHAVLQLGVVTAAMLPLLPDAGYGPYEALNPFRLWRAVILIAALSLAGHVAARWRGPQQGLLWSGLLGGLASSTAATLSLSRTARAQPALAHAAAAGVVGACGVMFLRMAAITVLLQPALASAMGGMLSWLAFASFLATHWLWRRAEHRPAPAAAQEGSNGSLFDLPTALGFGVLLAVVAIAVRAAKDHLGSAGVYAVAAISGLGDVDAPLVSSLHMVAQGELARSVAVTAVVLAVAANMVVKGVMAWVVGGRSLGRRVAAGYGVILLAAAAGIAWRLS